MEALKTMIQDMFGKDCSACTNQEVYEALLTTPKNSLLQRAIMRERKKSIISLQSSLLESFFPTNLINLGIYDEVARILKRERQIPC